MIREVYKEFKLIKPLLYRFLLIIGASFGGAVLSIPIVLGIVLYDLSKSDFKSVFIVFVVLLLFSDSNSPLFSTSGGNTKDLILILIVLFLIFKGKMYIQFSYLKYFALYILVAFIGLFLSNFSLIGLQKLLSYTLVILVVPVLLFLIFDKGDGLVFLKQLILIFAFFYGFSILMSRINPAVFAQFGRFNGIHRNPNGVGIFSTLFVMNMFLIKDKLPNIFSKKMFYTLVSIFIFAIVISGSRNAMISLGIFAGFRFLRVRFLIGLIIILVLAFSYNFILLQLEELVVAANLEKELRLDTLSYASGRIYIWQACWMEIQNNFYFGHGFSYEEYSKWDRAYVKILPMLIHNYGNIHNSYLTIWLNTGLIGLIAYLIGLFVYTIKFQFKSLWLAPFIFSALFMAFFESYMVASLNPYTWQLWFAFFIVTVSFKPSVFSNKNPKESAMTKEIPSMY